VCYVVESCNENSNAALAGQYAKMLNIIFPNCRLV